MPLTFGSLFAGIGGVDIGFEAAGLVCKWQVEIEDFQTKVLEKRFPNAKRHRDIHTFPTGEFDAKVDIIVGGDPCQENSNARQRTGLESPSLGHEFIRVVTAVRPRIVLRENPSAVRSDAPWPWWRFRASLESLGYSVLPFRLRSCCFGGDSQRDRLFLLAELSDTVQKGLEGDVLKKLERATKQKRVRNSSRQDRRSASPRICRAGDGIPDRVDRLKSLGNAVDPRVSEFIGRLIVEANK